ncbi:MAG: hypothetical protein ACXAC2_01495 [Candidatus Kariarchaeaceae archaeon]|jgi:hypothetical protein
MKLLNIIITVSFIFLLFISTSSAIASSEPVGDNDRDYYIRIELSQWSIKAFDMNQIEDLMLQGSSRDEAMKMSSYHSRIGPLIKGSRVFLEIYSFDVQHGLDAPDLGLKVVVNGPGQEYNKPTLVNFVLPSNDVSISATCNVYCGLGHSDMKLKFVIGNGSQDYSSQIFKFFIIANLLIFLIFIKKLFSPRPTKVYLQHITTNKSKSGFDENILVELNKLGYSKVKNGIGIFDISHLSEKQVIELRFENVEVDKIANLIGYYDHDNIKDAIIEIKTSKETKNWELFH